MKVTIKKLLSLIVIPAALIYLNYVLCVSIHMTLLAIISTIVIDLAIILACLLLWNQHKTYKFKVNFEYVPMCCVGIGVEGGVIGIILPFCVIAFGWIND
jgi:presenilin-like A22 family membrane protease